MKQSKPLSFHLNILFSLALAIFLTFDVETAHETTNLSSRTSSFIGSASLVSLCPALLILQVSLLLLGKGFGLVGVEEALFAALDPVVVAGIVVKDLLVQKVSSLSKDLDVASCCFNMSVRQVIALP